MLKLGVEGKQALLEQSLKLRNHGFNMLMLVNRRFINLARLRSVYRFEVRITSERACVWFEDHSGGGTKTIEIRRTKKMRRTKKICRLARFLDPKILVINDNEAFPKRFFQFLENSDCQIILSSLYSINSFLFKNIEHIWPRIIGISTYGDETYRLNDLSKKSLKMMSVTGISSLDQLQGALKHNVEDLSLLFVANFFEQTDLSRIQTFVPGRIKNCSLSWRTTFESTWPFSQNLVRLLNSSLLLVEVYICDDGHRSFETNNEVIQHLTNNVKCLARMTEALNETGINSIIDVEIEPVYIGKNVNVDWVDLFNKSSLFKDFQAKVNDGDGIIPLEIKCKVGKADIHFTYDIFEYAE